MNALTQFWIPLTLVAYLSGALVSMIFGPFRAGVSWCLEVLPPVLLLTLLAVALARVAWPCG